MEDEFVDESGVGGMDAAGCDDGLAGGRRHVTHVKAEATKAQWEI